MAGKKAELLQRLFGYLIQAVESYIFHVYIIC